MSRKCYIKCESRDTQKELVIHFATRQPFFNLNEIYYFGRKLNFNEISGYYRTSLGYIIRVISIKIYTRL